MTAGVTISTEHNEDRLTGTLFNLDRGSGNARVQLYDGTRPAGGGTPTTLLAEIALSKPAGVVASGALTLASTDLPTIANSGTATWARILTGNGDYSTDCDVSEIGGSGQIQIPSVMLYAGGKTALVSGVLR